MDSFLTSPGIPVITIDGPTASGKGTVAMQVAHALGFHYLDSGALYRLTALSIQRQQLDTTDEHALAKAARHLQVRFADTRIYLANEDVSSAIRHESVGNLASQIAQFQTVRQALHRLQLDFCKAPGLVADGRDMGTVVFPQALLKVFLTASVEARAQRRYKQLIEKGFSANISTLSDDLLERDRRDSQRKVAPLKPASGSYLLDTSDCSVGEAVERVLTWYTAVRKMHY